MLDFSESDLLEARVFQLGAQPGANPHQKELIPLKQANLIPKDTFIYNADQPVRLLLHLSGSSVKLFLLSPSFWGLMALHLLLLVVYWKVANQHSRVDSATAKDSAWPFLRTTTYTGYLGTLVSFCLVFQTTQSYNRCVSAEA
ncbi:hypothetical protein KFL_006840070 [Klebsormidium nitens]|uniref:Uncharacterized protein n=1 Tax=Klebsormidium nitens TaxID=105231 RepID=A0A1Y1IJ05_KLENI|nr:hypothetical protein KFL_006840070 [Klebsormidium nitens]|eukprot:GAQ90784.1 hypothetical protein KFL_006840070 [Klebsormidium nitens]